MNEAKASQPEETGPKARKVRNRNALLVSHDNELDRPSTSYKDTDLASYFAREFNEETGDFRRNNLLGRDFPSINMLDSSDLVRLQAEDIAVNSVNLFLLFFSF